MQAVSTLILAHGEIPALRVKNTMTPGCQVPHVLIQSLDDSMGIVGHPDDLLILAECIKRAVESQIAHVQESAKNHGQGGI